ncbi:4-phosphoerythronate dehydrogenase [Thiomicrospira sp. WB1]|uniref:4-phosphoerythronate dehydrogenase n=1 Tax=Thiomicrospira sp. WB1 TaxID=1685380 RepID=UPI0007467E7E|nr:4-phosphoerythronate dehydrogenase [Thiomicrospira sp. WB1]KUJ72714.1 erythronate-4-phosphate dehydrogenase [Thiomicrospira sp. WB1]
MQERTLIIDDAIPFGEAMFSHLGQVKLRPGKAIRPSDVANADALIVRSRTQVNADLLQDSGVSFVGSTVVGLDHIDQAWLKQQNIPFYSSQGCNANSVAEYVLTNIIRLAAQNEWNLTRLTLGIIGVGHVGKRLQTLAEAVGLTCLLNDPPRAAREGSDGFCELDEALKADIISLHTPLSHEGKWPTYHLLAHSHLARLSPNQVLINAARGGIVDEAAWVTAPMNENLIDCWENEPEIRADLYQKATLATPHIAGHALDAKIKGSEMVYEQLCQHWQIPPQQHWQAELPLPPAPLQIEPAPQLAKTLWQLLKQCYNPLDDDQAIRAKEIQGTHKKYEYYRRHYPVRREWSQHRVAKTPDKNLNKLLIELGFQLI